MAAFISRNRLAPPHDLRHIAEQLEQSGATRKMRIIRKRLIRLVGAIGFEPMTSTV